MSDEVREESYELDRGWYSFWRQRRATDMLSTENGEWMLGFLRQQDRITKAAGGEASRDIEEVARSLPVSISFRLERMRERRMFQTDYESDPIKPASLPAAVSTTKSSAVQQSSDEQDCPDPEEEGIPTVLKFLSEIGKVIREEEAQSDTPSTQIELAEKKEGRIEEGREDQVEANDQSTPRATNLVSMLSTLPLSGKLPRQTGSQHRTDGDAETEDSERTESEDWVEGIQKKKTSLQTQESMNRKVQESMKSNGHESSQNSSSLLPPSVHVRSSTPPTLTEEDGAEVDEKICRQARKVNEHVSRAAGYSQESMKSDGNESSSLQSSFTSSSSPSASKPMEGKRSESNGDDDPVNVTAQNFLFRDTLHSPPSQPTPKMQKEEKTDKDKSKESAKESQRRTTVRKTKEEREKEKKKRFLKEPCQYRVKRRKKKGSTRLAPIVEKEKEDNNESSFTATKAPDNHQRQTSTAFPTTAEEEKPDRASLQQQQQSREKIDADGKAEKTMG